VVSQLLQELRLLLLSQECAAESASRKKTLPRIHSSPHVSAKAQLSSYMLSVLEPGLIPKNRARNLRVFTLIIGKSLHVIFANLLSNSETK